METEEFSVFLLHYWLSIYLMEIRAEAALKTLDLEKTYLLTHVIHNLPLELYHLQYGNKKLIPSELVDMIKKKAIAHNVEKWFDNATENAWLVYNEMPFR